MLRPNPKFPCILAIPPLPPSVKRGLSPVGSDRQICRSGSEVSLQSRQWGRSGLMVPELTLGTGTFGGDTAFFKA